LLPPPSANKERSFLPRLGSPLKRPSALAAAPDRVERFRNRDLRKKKAALG